MLEGVCGMEKKRSMRRADSRHRVAGGGCNKTASPERVFKQRWGGGEKGEKGSMQMSGEAVPGRGTRQCKGPEVEKEQQGGLDGKTGVSQGPMSSHRPLL